MTIYNRTIQDMTIRAMGMASADLDDGLDAAYKAALRYSPAPLSPDHSGGAGEVVLPAVWRIPVCGEWFYGTKEQCIRERVEYESTFTIEDFKENGVVVPEPLGLIDKVKELNQ